MVFKLIIKYVTICNSIHKNLLVLIGSFVLTEQERNHIQNTVLCHTITVYENWVSILILKICRGT